MSETLKYEVSNFRITPGAVSFGGNELGGTDGEITISVKASYYESKCNQAGEQVLRKIYTSVSASVKAKFKEIDKALAAALGEGKKLTTALIGTDLYANAKALEIAEISGTTVHTFPKAAVLPESLSYAITGTAEHGIELEFECIGGADGTVYSVSTASA